MNDMNTFLKQKLKDNHMRVDRFIDKSGVSKSTMYRVMKGYQKPSEELLETMCGILNLNFMEEQELRYYSSLADTSDDLLSAHRAVADLLLSRRDANPEAVELVYYDGEKYIRDFDAILGGLREHFSDTNFSCSIRMVNCCQDRIITPIFDFVTELSRDEKDYGIEHLVNFSTTNSTENITVLSEIIPLLCIKKYSAKYCESEGAPGNGIFKDFMILDISFTDAETGRKKDRQLYFSFLGDNLSACYVCDSGNMRDFFERNYRAIHKDYISVLNNNKKYEFIGPYLEEAEKSADLYLFKPNPCYYRIPISVYRHIEERCRPMQQFLEAFLTEEVTEKSYPLQAEGLMQYMERRYKYSFLHKQVDILSRGGMERFASTGILSDGMAYFPPLNGEELREVLETMKKRDLDEKDLYNFYILKEEYGNNSLEIYVPSKNHIFVEYDDPAVQTNDTPCCIIDNESFTEVFIDFAKNYVPTMLAMPQNEAHAFIDKLIEKYC